MLFAHLSDVHLPLTQPKLTELLHAKSFLSFLSWHHKRKKKHLLSATDLLVADLKAQNPDHICLTGDLVNSAFSSELVQAKAWLQSLNMSEKISFVPGNHDALTKKAYRQKEHYFGPWMNPEDGGKTFPYLQVKGGVAFIGVDTAIPTLPILSQGEVGQEQCAKLDTILKETGAKGLFRVVMIHHPPLPGQTAWKRKLIDAPALKNLLVKHKVELVLHGHEHKPTYVHLEDVGTKVFGAASSSLMDFNKKRFPQYCLFDVSGGKLNKITRRVYLPEEGKFVEKDC